MVFNGFEQLILNDRTGMKQHTFKRGHWNIPILKELPFGLDYPNDILIC